MSQQLVRPVGRAAVAATAAAVAAAASSSEENCQSASWTAVSVEEAHEAARMVRDGSVVLSESADGTQWLDVATPSSGSKALAVPDELLDLAADMAADQRCARRAPASPPAPNPVAQAARPRRSRRPRA